LLLEQPHFLSPNAQIDVLLHVLIALSLLFERFMDLL
jgi:hypothetical protein